MSDDNVNPPRVDLTIRAKQAFVDQFGRPPSIVVTAPGRVNLIGEHIDYNDGFVLPFAIQRYVTIAAAPRTDEADLLARIQSLDFAETLLLPRDQSLQPGRTGWGAYLEGVVAGFQKLEKTFPSFDAVVGSDVPVGGGLSSSAALEVAMATLLEQLSGRQLDPRQKALLCQKAEHDFAGVPCGIMDQFSSVFGQLDQLMLIDCRSQEVELVPFDSAEVALLIANSNVKHDLADGEYGNRRSQCNSALGKIKAKSWRNVGIERVEQSQGDLTDQEYRRARHVVTEIERTQVAARAFVDRDWKLVGELMYQSHVSLRDDYEVSCHELDILVEIAKEMGLGSGVYGSRMTGGGFGGCTVSLVRTSELNPVKEGMCRQYQESTGLELTCFSSRPAQGAHVVEGEGVTR